MSVLLVLCGVVVSALPGFSLALSHRTRPAALARLNSLALTIGPALILMGLMISATVGVAHLATGSTSMRYDAHLAPEGIAGSMISMAILGFVAVRLASLARRAHRGRRIARPDGWMGEHRLLGEHELVVLPVAEPIAYSLNGDPPQVVISEGLRDRLDGDLFRFVIDHERAHLRRRDGRALLLAAAVDATFGVLPWISRSTIALRVAIERAADEDAAGRVTTQRTRLASGLARLSTDLPSTTCPTETLPFRAQQLLASPVRRLSPTECAATFGLVGLVVAAGLVLACTTADVPTLVAAFRA